MKKFLLLIVLAISLQGCFAATEKEADTKTYDALGMEYANYVYQDASLSRFEKKVRTRTVLTWAKRLKKYNDVSMLQARIEKLEEKKDE